MSEMKPWPDPDDYCEGTNSMYEESQQCLRYERARAEAALARLRVAVEALSNINAAGNGPTFLAGSPKYDPAKVANWCIDAADEALAAIGEIPE